MKTILIDDWYAPEFGVRINDARKCLGGLNRRRGQPTPFFRPSHVGSHRAGALLTVRRRNRFAEFQVA